jgi:hypothetical protein
MPTEAKNSGFFGKGQKNLAALHFDEELLAKRRP